MLHNFYADAGRCCCWLEHTCCWPRYLSTSYTYFNIKIFQFRGERKAFSMFFHEFYLALFSLARFSLVCVCALWSDGDRELWSRFDISAYNKSWKTYTRQDCESAEAKIAGKLIQLRPWCGLHTHSLTHSVTHSYSNAQQINASEIPRSNCE